MGMSTHVVGVRNNDLFEKYCAIQTACERGGIKTPKEVMDYFEDREYSEDMGGEIVDVEMCAFEWSGDSKSGIEIVVADIPKGVEKIIVYNAW